MPSHVELLCNYCGKKYVGQPKQKYCSRHCARIATNGKKKNPANFRNCKTCGILFYYQPSRSKGIYCSKHCDIEDKKIPTKYCIVCNKEYTPDRSESKRWNSSKYCSNDCMTKAKFKGKYSDCKVCGKKYWIRPSREKTRNNSFCSKKCWAVWQKDSMLGENNPHWKGGLVKIRKKQAGIWGKGNAHYRKGKYYERKTRKMLEKDNYYTIRSGASKGIFDIVGIRKNDIRLIQVKGGNSFLSPAEKKAIKDFDAPDCASKEAWLFCGKSFKIIKSDDM